MPFKAGTVSAVSLVAGHFQLRGEYMDNQINQENQENTEHSSFYDQADQKFNQSIQNQDKLAKGVTDDSEISSASGGEEYSENLAEEQNMGDAESQVRATEDASLQDETYSFDEANTDNEEFHDVDDYEDFDLDLDNDDDYVQ